MKVGLITGPAQHCAWCKISSKIWLPTVGWGLGLHGP